MTWGSSMTYGNLVLRRAQFILDEACSKDAVRDLAVVMTMRAISNYLTVGRDGSSWVVKKQNQFMSKAAHELKSKLTANEWHKATTNEHQWELLKVWQTICERADSLSATDVCDLMREYPFVTITNLENTRLREPDVRAASTPEERYSRAGIEVIQVELSDSELLGE